MNIKVHSLHFDADQRLLDFSDNKIIKLSQYEDKIISAEVFLRLEKSADTNNKVAEIKVAIAKGEVFAKKQCRSFEEAIDQTVDALRRQLVKQKQKKLGR